MPDIEVVQIPGAQARDVALEHLGLAAIAVIRQTPDEASAIVPEVLRSVLWGLWTGARQPIGTRRILDMAEGRLHVFFPAQETVIDQAEGGRRAYVRATLDGLALVGDVAELRGGRWIPAPLRTVAVDGTTTLLLGGRPTRLVQRAIQRHGLARTLQAGADTTGLPRQELSLWLRCTEDDLEAWTTRVLASAHLTEFEGGLDCESYAPDLASRQAIQYWRWRDGVKSLPDGRRLMRVKSRFGDTRHLIGEIRNGRLAKTGPLPIPAADRRRLMYGLDALAGNPTKVEVASTRIVLRSGVPSAEERLLTALGRFEPTGGGYYPRIWNVDPDHVNAVRDALARLRVTIEDARE